MSTAGLVYPATANLEDAFTLQDAAAANGNGNAYHCEGWNAVLVQVTGTFSATVNWEATLDGTNYVAVQAGNLNDGAVGTTATAAGLYLIGVPGAEKVRARISGYSSGSVTVKGRGTPYGAAGTFDIDIAGTETVTATGPAADGAAASGNPVRVAGKDGSGNTQDLATDTDGRLELSAGLSAADPLFAAPGTLSVLAVGEFAPGIAAAQFPAVANAKLVVLKARSANTGKVYVGLAGVTKADGTTDTTTGLELIPGDAYPIALPISNLNVLYGIGDNAADSVTYTVLG